MNETIRTLREQNNYSQAAVASYLNISRQMYIKYENGDAIPPVKIVKTLSDFYRVPYDVIIEDKLNKNNQVRNENTHTVSYKTNADTGLEIHEAAPAYGATNSSPSYYLNAVLEMLPKLVYKEQLKVLEKLSGMVQHSTEEKLKPNKLMQDFNKLSKYANNLHLKSDGSKWTRDELYER